MICDTLGVKLEASAVSELIQEQDIYSIGFETTVPISMQIAVQIDGELHKRGLGENKTAQILYDVYEMAGKILVSSDGNASATEQADMETYLGMLQSFMRESADSDNAQFDGIVMPSKKRG